MTTLSNEDKISIINQHKRNVEYNKYSTEVLITLENASTVPNQGVLDSYNEQIAEYNNKLAVLDAEIAELQ